MAEVLSPAAYALLEAIAKSESAGDWNVIYGGSQFDSYADHPRQYVTIKSGPNKGDVSSAAGKYQILASTYDNVAPKLGITDFSPESQLRIAWYLAEDAYGPNLERDLQSGSAATIARVGKKLRNVWTSLPGGIEQGQTSNTFVKNFNRAMATRAGMKVPGMLGDDPLRIRESIQDRNAARLGYGKIAPNPVSGRPAYFNETGAPPIPLSREVGAAARTNSMPPLPRPRPSAASAPQPVTMSPALAAARQRLAVAREARLAASGVTTPAAMAATPRITDTDPQAAARRPSLDWGAFRPSMSAGGVGSLLDGGINPATPNPSRPPVAGLRLPTLPTTVAGRPDAPVGALPAQRTGTTVAGRPDAPIGSMPAARAASAPIPLSRPSFASTPAAQPADKISNVPRGPINPGPVVHTPVNAGVLSQGGKISNPAVGESVARPAAAPAQPRTAKLGSGTTVEIGRVYQVGGKPMIAEMGPNGIAVMKPAADPGILKEAGSNTIAGGEIRKRMGEAVGGAVRTMSSGAPGMLQPAIAGAGNAVAGVASFAGNTLEQLGRGLFPQSSSSSSSGGAVTKPANTLSAPGAGLTAAQREAMTKVPLSAAVKPLTPAAPAKQNTLIQTTITNPAYTEWVKKYGDGSQVQTAPTGGMITKNQLAAIQNVNAAVQAPIVKPPPIPPAPPKTITVMKPGNNTLPPVPVSRPAAAPSAPPPVPVIRTAQTVSGKTVNVGQTYQAGGYLYSANANGSFTKVGKVGSSANVLSSMSTTTPQSSASSSSSGSSSGSSGTSSSGSSGTITGSSTGQTYNVGQTYQGTNGYTYQAQSDGTFKKV